MNGRLISACLLIFTCGYASAQVAVDGKVRNSSGAPIPFATLMVIDTLRNNIAAYTSASKIGDYNFTISNPGIYYLIGRALGHKADTTLLKITDQYKFLTKDLTLREDVQNLKEVIVSSAQPVIVKRDTIIIDAKSFALGNEQVAEDLLKRIPGLEVTADGTIKVGNREVERVMVDGDDFFEKGYKLLTKNLSAGTIDKVEIYDKYSKNRLLHNIENSDKVALNLKLKADSKQQWFGNISAGYGIGAKHELRTNLMAYRPKAKYYLLANINNTGYDASGDIRSLVSPENSGGPNAIEDKQTLDPMSNLNVKQPQLRRSRINFNNVVMPALNGIWTLTDKMKLKVMSLLNLDKNDFVTSGSQTFFTTAQPINVRESSQTNKKTFSAISRLNYLYDINPRSSFEYTGVFNSSKNTDTANSFLNSNQIRERLTKRDNVYDHKFIYTNKISEKTVLLLSARYLNERQPENYLIDSVRYPILASAGAKLHVDQETVQQMKYAALEGRLLTKQSNGSLLEFQAGYVNRMNTFDSHLATARLSNFQYLEPFSNQISYSAAEVYGKANYRYKIGNYHLVAGVEGHQLLNKVKQADSLDYLKQSPFFLVPALGFEWQMNKTSKFTVTYRYSFNNTQVSDIYKGYILTDYLTFSRGLDDFNQMKTSAVLLNYRLGNWGDNFFMNSTIAYKKDSHFISTDNLIQQDYIAKSKIVLGSRNQFNAMLSTDRYISPISSNIKAKFSFDNSDYKNRIGGIDVNTRSSTYNYGLEMRSAFHGFFNFNVGRSWTYSRIKSSFDNTFNNNMSFLDLDFIFKNNLSLRTQGELYHFENLNVKNNQLFIDAELRYAYPRSKFTFFVSGRNLLNRKEYTEQTNQDISVSVWQYRLVPRIINLKIDYRF